MKGKCICQSSVRKEGACDNNYTFSKTNKINKLMQRHGHTFFFSFLFFCGKGIRSLMVKDMIETILS